MAVASGTRDRTSVGLRLMRIGLAPSRLLQRSQGGWRVLLTAIYLVLGLVLATLTYRQTQLLGLPEVTVPFDVKALPTVAISDDQNAWIPFMEAVDLYRPPDHASLVVSPFRNPALGTATINPEVWDWVRANRPALERFRQAWELPDAFDPAARSGTTSEFLEVSDIYYRLCGAALLEAQRLLEADDPARAWDWYRSVLRSSWLIGRRTGELGRYLGQNMRGRLTRRLKTWAEHPKVDVPLLRLALADIQACESLMASEVDILRSAYFACRLNFEAFYDNSAESDGPALEPGGFLLSKSVNARFYEVKRWLRRDRERSSRVFNLVFANWLGYLEIPPEQRPKPTIRVSGGTRMQGIPYDFYGAPVLTALKPQVLAGWFASTIDLKTKLPSLAHHQGLKRNDMLTQASFIILIAEQIYLRDHGMLPTFPEKLVGTVLDRLPGTDGGEMDYGDVPILKIEDPQADLD